MPAKPPDQSRQHEAPVADYSVGGRSTRRPRIAAIGLASWDRLLVVDRYPTRGAYAVVRETSSQPGGTTSNAAVAMARLGASVAIVALVGDDAEGQLLRRALDQEGVDTRWLATDRDRPTDGATVIVSRQPPDRTIYWHQGARLARGDRLDVAAIFGHDVVLLDVDDAPLRRFLVDLPVHTLPSARLLGTLTYLVDSDQPDAFAVALRHDVVVGNEREFCALTARPSLDAVIARLQAAMPGANLRSGVVTRGAEGATAFTSTERWDEAGHRVDVVDATGAGDAFAGAIAYSMALRWDWPRALRLANAVAALSTRALGAQASLPTPAEVSDLLGFDHRSLKE
jgi:sugar/nucleoside kinase (ribokinase family)